MMFEKGDGEFFEQYNKRMAEPFHGEDGFALMVGLFLILAMLGISAYWIISSIITVFS